MATAPHFGFRLSTQPTAAAPPPCRRAGGPPASASPRRPAWRRKRPAGGRSLFAFAPSSYSGARGGRSCMPQQAAALPAGAVRWRRRKPSGAEAPGRWRAEPFSCFHHFFAVIFFSLIFNQLAVCDLVIWVTRCIFAPCLSINPRTNQAPSACASSKNGDETMLC